MQRTPTRLGQLVVDHGEDQLGSEQGRRLGDRGLRPGAENVEILRRVLDGLGDLAGIGVSAAGELHLDDQIGVVHFLEDRPGIEPRGPRYLKS